MSTLEFGNQSLDQIAGLDWEQQSLDQIDRLSSVQPARAAASPQQQQPVFEAPPMQSLAPPRRPVDPTAGQIRTVWKADPSQADLFGSPAAMPQGQPSRADTTPSATGVAAPQVAAPPQAAIGAPAAMPSGQSTTAPSVGDGSDIDNSNRQTFARTAYPLALQAAGGDPELAKRFLAMAISENGTVGAGGAIGVGNNFGGIKYDPQSIGSGNYGTWESEGGQRVNQNADFAAYANPQEGFNAIPRFIQTNMPQAWARYQQTHDAAGLIRDINAAGYATNPTWHQDIESIANGSVAPGLGNTTMPKLGAADLPDTGLSAGDQKRAKLAAASDVTNGQAASQSDMLRQPLGPPTSGPDTSGASDTLPFDPREQDAGPREAAPPDLSQTPPAQYGSGQDDPGAAPLPFDVAPDITMLPSTAPLASDQANMVEMPTRTPQQPVVASYGASADDPGQAPTPPRVDQASFPAIPGLIPVTDGAGKLLRYIEHGAEAIGSQISQNVAGNRQAVEDANAGQSGGVNFGQGVQNLVNALPEPAVGGMLDTERRIRQIQDAAAAAQGITDPVRAMRAADDPTWRAQNPELAQEYDDLQNEAMLTVGGMVGSGGEAFRSKGPPTVEVLQQRVEQANSIVQRLLHSGDAKRLAMAQDSRAALESQLIDAQNARLRLEPRIRSDVGAREADVNLPAFDEAPDRRLDARFPPRPATMAPEDLSGPVSIPTDTGNRLNSGVGVNNRPGLVPTLANAAQGGVLGDVAANQEDDRRQQQGLPPMTPAERAAFIASGAGLAVAAGRAMRGREPGQRLGSGAVPEFDRPNRPPVLGDVPPSRIKTPALEGFERPPTPVDPALRGTVSPEPNVPLSITQAQANAGAQQAPIPGLVQQPAPAPIGQVAPQFQVPPAVQNAVQVAQRQQRPGVSPLEWWRRFAAEVGYSSMIGPATATVNLTGNVLEPLWAIPKEAARAVARGNPREFGEMAGGAFHGLSEVGSAILDALTASGRYAATPGHEPLSAVTNTPIGRAVTTGLEVGGRVFSAVPDAIFGTIAQGAGEARTAAQVATDAGLKGTTWKQYVNDLLTDAKAVKGGQLPTLADTQRVLDEGAAYAKRQTFRDQLGTYGKRARTFARVGDMPVVGNLMTPFFNTPWNMGLRVSERSPLGFLMNSQGSKFDKLYDATVGSALLIGLAAGPVATGTITGGGPDDPQKKAEMRSQGWRPYSTLIDGVYVPNRTFGIYAPLLNAAADVHDSIAYSKQGTPGSIASNYAGRLGQQLQQQPYLQGISNFLQMIQSGQGGGLGSAAERYASSTITRMVPYAATARTIGTATDPYERTVDQGKNVPTEATIGQQVQSGVGMRSGLPIAQDVLGRPQENPQQGVKSLFARTSSERPDPVVQTYLSANVDIPAPRTSITQAGAKLELTPDERRRWNEVRGEMLQRFVGPLAQSGAFDRMAPMVREKMLTQYLDMAAQQADTRVFAEMAAADRARRIREGLQQKQKAS